MVDYNEGVLQGVLEGVLGGDVRGCIGRELVSCG